MSTQLSSLNFGHNPLFIQPAEWAPPRPPRYQWVGELAITTPDAHAFRKSARLVAESVRGKDIGHDTPYLPVRTPIVFGLVRVSALRVNTCSLEALLLEEEKCPTGHRGLWFYSPGEISSGQEVEVGELVFFICNESVVEVGRVTEIVTPGPDVKICSRSNDRGFRWEGITPEAQVPRLYGSQFIRDALQRYQLPESCIAEILGHFEVVGANP